MEGVAQEETRRGEASDGVAILNLLTKHILADVLGRLEAHGKRRRGRSNDIVVDALREAIVEALRVGEHRVEGDK